MATTPDPKPADPPAKRKLIRDPEILALSKIDTAMAELPDAARARVAVWIADKYGPRFAPVPGREE